MLDNGAIDRATWQSARATTPVSSRQPAGGRAARPVFQGAGPPGARRTLRMGARLSGRASRVFRRSTCRCRKPRRRRRPNRSRDSMPDVRSSRPAARRRRRERRGPIQSLAGGARRDGSGHRPGARDGRRPRLRRQPFQSRRPGAPAAGVRLQALRVCGRARGRLYACEPHRTSQRSDRHAAGRVCAGGRTFERGVDDTAHRSANLEQSRRCPPAAGDRDLARRAVCEDDGRWRCAERSVAGARIRRGDPGIDDRGVCRVRQPGQGAGAGSHSTRRGSRRQPPVSLGPVVARAPSAKPRRS